MCLDYVRYAFDGELYRLDVRIDELLAAYSAGCLREQHYETLPKKVYVNVL